MGIERVVIVGAGQAGAQVAVSLRQQGYAGAICLVGDEPAPPYQRPPLSKGFLKGELPEERLWLKAPGWYEEQGVTLRTGIAVESVDREGQAVTLADREVLPWDALVLATGSRPRRLRSPGAGLPGVMALRTLADARALGESLRPGARLLVVGAGYVGLEVAASARALGCEVVVLEAEDRVLSRVAGPTVSRFFEAEHRARGVDLRCGARLEGFEGRDRLEGARLADGSRVAADVAVVGVGAEPGVELAEACGLACDNGIVVDRDARTSDPRVFAAGDCTRRPLVHYGREGRLESVHNAIEQGKIVAASILGLPRPAEDVPWFWSDQYDLKLQTIGLAAGCDREVLRGDPTSRRFAVFSLRDGVLLAADAVNSPGDFVASRPLVAKAARPDPAMLADASVPMKEIVAASAA